MGRRMACCVIQFGGAYVRLECSRALMDHAGSGKIGHSGTPTELEFWERRDLAFGAGWDRRVQGAKVRREQRS